MLPITTVSFLRVFTVSKGLFTWWRGTPGGWGKPLRWANPSYGLPTYHVNVIKLKWEIIIMDRWVTPPKRFTLPTGPKLINMSTLIPPSSSIFSRTLSTFISYKDPLIWEPSRKTLLTGRMNQWKISPQMCVKCLSTALNTVGHEAKRRELGCGCLPSLRRDIPTWVLTLLRGAQPGAGGHDSGDVWAK